MSTHHIHNQQQLEPATWQLKHRLEPFLATDSSTLVKALLEDRWQTPDADFALQPLPSAKPPERPVLERRAYAEAYRRTNRLLI